MQVAKTDNDRSLTLAQIEFCDQLKRSDQSGQALWWPRVAAGEPAPDCVVLIEEICRFGVMFPPGRYSVEGGNWYRHDADGKTEVPDLIEAAWQAARQIRLAIKGELRRGAYTIPVIIFNGMGPDAGIMEAAQGRGVRVFFGQDEVVQRLVNLPDEEQLQPRLGSGDIQQEVEVLSRTATPEVKTPEAKTPEQAFLEIGDGRLVIQHVDVVNIYINSGPDASGGASLPDVPGS